jgi:peptidoglycan/LPS O-acetylase OafA/YrhL
LWLDGARGIAAIAVMCYHYEQLLHLRPLLHSAYLAVDLFFMMSGFVLGHSYEDKLRSGRLTVRKYMVHRAIRLYPTYAAATALGLAYYAGKIVLRARDAPHLVDLLQILGSNLFFIPIMTKTMVPQGMFPFAPTSWSLSTEVLASIMFGLVLARARTRLLLGIIVVFGGLFFAYVAALRGFDLGWGISNFVPGIFRTLFEFTIGIVLYRVSSYSSRKRLLHPAILLAAICAVFLFLMGSSLIGIVPCVLVLFPLFILSAEGRRVDGALQIIFHQLGRVSYPVYLIHAPVLLWFAGAYKLIENHNTLAIDLRWLGWMMVACTLLLSYAIARWIDEPVRAWLNVRLRASGATPDPAAAKRCEPAREPAPDATTLG